MTRMNSELIIHADDPLGWGVVAYYTLFPDLHFLSQTPVGESHTQSYLKNSIVLHRIARLPPLELSAIMLSVAGDKNKAVGEVVREQNDMF